MQSIFLSPGVIMPTDPHAPTPKLPGEFDYSTCDPLVSLETVREALRPLGIVVGQTADGAVTMTRLKGSACWCGVPAQPDWIELRLRQEWWMGHGCPWHALYGDDGEMQCNALTCMRDFKREPMERLREHVESRRLQLAAEAWASVPAATPEKGDV